MRKKPAVATVLALTAAASVLLTGPAAAQPDNGSGPGFLAMGFPDGEFSIVDEESGLCLTSRAGEVVERGDGREYGRRRDRSTHTLNPTVHARACDGSDRQRWYFDTSGAGTYSEGRYLLVNTVKEGTRGRFALTYRRDLFGSRADVALVGVGSNNALAWQSEDGYIFERGRPRSVIAYVPDGGKPIMAARGSSAHQRWRFLAAE
ncbi:RICIN domain-containing protein [Nocardia brevicatena]|uniref:RICIN domain-containing protein n=1 Tax=Nocardia brevicatena TaxID=37327 RepID=UPI0002F624FE|nr:RICIN domain-containing protein [Nocardia brevicatena]